LHLVDEKTGDAATLILAADKGTVLSAEGFTKSRTAPPPVEADPRRQANREGNQRPPQNQGRPNFFQRAGDSVNHFFDRVGTHLERRGRQIGDKVHNVINGDNRDTAGPHRPGDPETRNTPPPPPNPQQQPPPSRVYRDANGTEYIRPRD
jgi:hypothetical protein